MAGANVDVTTADAVELENGQTYRVTLTIGGGGLLAPTATTIAEIVNEMTDRGFGSVHTWTDVQYSDLPDDWPRAEDPQTIVFPDWTLRIEGMWTGPNVTFSRDLSDLATGASVNVVHAWRYVPSGDAPIVPVLPTAPETTIPLAVWIAGAVVALATAALVAIGLTQTKRRRRRRLRA